MKLGECSGIHHGIPNLIALGEQILMCASLRSEDPVRRQHVLGSVGRPLKSLTPRFNGSVYDRDYDVSGEEIREASRDDYCISAGERGGECGVRSKVDDMDALEE